MLLKPIAPAPEPLHSADNRVNVAKAENAPSPAFAPARENKDVRPLRSNIPRVVLDMDTISSAMAARLAKSLLCHLLYQKSQVPLMVAPLFNSNRTFGTQADAKSPRKRVELDAKASKKCEELLTAIDTLSSHLQTTFTSLSTALGAAQSSPGIDGVSGVLENPLSGRSYMAMVLGTNVGTAKARFMLGIDGLKIEKQGKGEELCVEGSSLAGDDEDEHSTSSESDDSEEEEEDSDCESDSDSHPAPPLSRSPSPVDSRPPSPVRRSAFQIFTGDENDCTTGASSSNLSPRIQPPTVLRPSSQTPLRSFKVFSDATEEPGPPEPSQTGSDNSHFTTPKPSPLPKSPQAQATPSPHPLSNKTVLSSPSTSTPTKLGPKTGPPPSQTYAEEQRALQSADRLLSRTLMSACAEENGGISAELPPTQALVFLRAPRRFSHPAWLPRQNLTRTLEGQLQTFIDEAACEPNVTSSKKPRRLDVKTEGVWLGCTGSKRAMYENLSQTEGVAEEDEMIWWQWDGKIIGFAN